MRSQGIILTSQHFLVFIFMSYAFVVSVFIDAEQRNYLVLFAAMIGGLLFLPLKLALQRQVFWAFLLFSVMSMRALSVGGVGELGSVAFTFVYALGYFAIASLLERIENKRTFVLRLMRWFIYAFTIVSVVQMVTSLSGLPVPNVIASKGLWSYNSLSYEPSQLGRVVGISMLCYLMLARLSGQQEPFKVRCKVLIAFLTTMLLSGSALAAIAVPLVFGLSRSLKWMVFIVIVSFSVWPMAQLIDFEPLQRVFSLLSSLGSLDVDEVLKAEHSGGLRVAPLLVYLRDASMVEFGFWFGYGDQGLSRFFLGQIRGLGDRVAAGFIPGFAVVYGVLTTAFFVWVFVVRQANRITLPLIAFWTIFIVNSAWNTQVFWYGLIIIQVSWAVSREVGQTSSSVKL